ncbi:NACHT domain-containing protein [Mesorhizobium sp. M0387]|uniref:NACHT domain-containing protein n=1 Tax=Mesorhizobium sp. M0387 TaxID=2956940 RepID=UPI0033354D70
MAALGAALEAVVASLVEKKVISDSESPIQQKRREDRFRRTESALTNLSFGNDLTHPENFSVSLLGIATCSETDSYVFHTIASNVERLVDEIDVHGAFGDIHRVSLDDVFVDLTLQRYSVGRERIQGSFRFENLAGHAIWSEPSDEISGWSGLTKVAQRRVLLGNPGGGKSTHSKKVCLEISRAAQKGGIVLPFFLQLRSYAAARSRQTNISIIEYIYTIAHEYVPDVEQDELLKIINYLLSVGRCFVVFDGLDEVLSGSSRLEIAKLVNAFCDRYPLSSFLVTSRIVGYETAPLKGFDHFIVRKLDDKQIGEILTKVSISVLGKAKERVERERPTFMSDAKKKAEELISNPLLLTLITIIHARRKEIPDNRADLYATCADLLFERWDSFRDINPDLPERYRLYDLLMHISALLYEDPAFGGNINKSDLVKVSKRFFLGDYTDNAQGKASEAAVKLVDHLTGRAWILHEVGDEVFEFTHRTFLEFFYAQSLDARFEVTEALLDDLLPYIREGQRTLPAHLSLQMRARDKRAVSDRIARHLTEAKKNVNVLRFCSDTLEYLTPNGEALVNYVRHLTSVAMKVGDDMSLLHIVGTENPLRNVIFSAFADEFIKTKNVEQLAGFSPVLDGLARISGYSTKALPQELLPSITKISDAFRSWQIRSPFVLRWIFDCTGDPDWDLARSFNLRLWTSKWTKNRNEGALFDGVQMLSEISSHADGWPLETLRYAKLAYAVAESSFANAGKYDLIVNYNNVRGLGIETHTKDIHLDGLNDDAISAVMFAAMFFVETREIYGFMDRTSEAKPHESIFSRIGSKEGYKFCHFARRWINAEVSLFGGGRGKDVRDRVLAQLH